MASRGCGRTETALCLVLENRCQEGVEGTVRGVILIRLKETSILVNDISVNTLNQGRTQQAIDGENFVQIKLDSTEYNMELQNSERRNS